MTILEIINKVCDVIGLDQFESVYGSDDDNAMTMLALAWEAGDEISRRSDWQKLLKTETVLSSGSALPTDFKRFIPGGGVNTSVGVFVRPVTNGAQWTVMQAGTPAQPYYFISGGTIGFAPSTAGDNAVLRYVSKNWIQPNVGSATDEWTADDDQTIFPEDLMIKGLMWRWRRQKGAAFNDQLAEFEADLLQAITSDRGLA